MQYLALLTMKVFIACVWTFGCCKQPTSTNGSIMVWLKRRLYMSKYMNNHIYSTLFKIQERKSDRRSKEIEPRKESQNTHI